MSVKASLEPIAKRLFANGMTIAGIGEQLGLSTTTVAKWKKASLRPGEEADDWELARQQKVSRSFTAYQLYDRHFGFLMDAKRGGISSADADMVSKLAANARTLRKEEREEEAWLYSLVRKPEQEEIDYAKLFMENLEWILQVLREEYPEGLKVISNVLPSIIARYKEEALRAEEA